MNIFIVLFFVLCAICLLLFFYTYKKIETSNDPGFLSFQRLYVAVYMLAMAGDWLQGPYVYALYENYGMNKSQIELLFVAGFGSSMVFGTIVGSFADKIGRKKNCIIYGVLYGLSCVTKHFADFKILMIGRILGGIATSLLYSAFESWLLAEHTKRNFDSNLQGTIFSHAFLGNSVVAIISGVVAQYSVDAFGFVAPFDVAIVVLTVMNGVIVCMWSENYGDSKGNIFTNFKTSFKAIFTDYKILSLGCIQSLFEGSMYCFVLEWTPALSITGESSKSNVDGHRGKIPHGYIFAAFMVAMMIGSCAFKVLEKKTKIESFMRYVLAVSGLCLALPFLIPDKQIALFIGFIIFEICVGIFWPSMGTLRGKYVPEETRATIMNCFRVPLNLIVVFILSQNFEITFVFKLCTIFLALSVLLQHFLLKLSEARSDSSESTEKFSDPV